MDDLYRFLHVWVPHLYGELNEAEIRERGYEPIDEDTDWGDEDAAKVRFFLIISLSITR